MSWSGDAGFWHQLGTLLRAGLPLSQALPHAGAAAPSRRAAAARWAAGCSAGQTLTEQLVADAMPPAATAIVGAGEASGRLPELCLALARRYEHLDRARRATIARLAYVTLLVHAALVVPAVPPVVLGTRSPWLLLAGPAALWGLGAVIALALWFARRAGLAGRIALIPPLKMVVMPAIVADACEVLAAAFAAGMLVPRALELAAGGCGNRVVAARLRAAAAEVAAGRLPGVAPALAASGFPTTTVMLIANGEVGGTTEAALARAATFNREAFEERLTWAVKIVTGTIYALVMAIVAMEILALFAQVYVAPLKEAMEAGD